MSVSFFGVHFASSTKRQVLKQVSEAFVAQKNIRIATVNPEYLLEAKNNKAFRESLNHADIRIVDGFGIQLVAWLRGVRLTRVTGADLLSSLLRFAEKNEVPLTIYNQQVGLSTEEDIRDVLGNKYPKLKIIYNKELVSYSLVLCTYGAPEQEMFLDMLGKSGIKIGVGGALDFMTGKQKRAPKLIRKLGLEWLWRLMLQPKRFKRIWNAVAVFPVQAILDILKPMK